MTRELLFRDGPKVRVSEFFYTIHSLLHGRMTVAWTDRDMMVADREMALIDPDKSEVSELMEREEPCAAPAPMTRKPSDAPRKAFHRNHERLSVLSPDRGMLRHVRPSHASQGTKKLTRTDSTI